MATGASRPSMDDGSGRNCQRTRDADAKAIIGKDGIGCEPASAATLAGVRKLVAAGVIGKHESVVGVLTGSLLKDPGYTVDYHTGKLLAEKGPIEGRYCNRPTRVPADKSKIRELLAL